MFWVIFQLEEPWPALGLSSLILAIYITPERFDILFLSSFRIPKARFCKAAPQSHWASSLFSQWGWCSFFFLKALFFHLWTLSRWNFQQPSLWALSTWILADSSCNLFNFFFSKRRRPDPSLTEHDLIHKTYMVQLETVDLSADISYPPWWHYQHLSPEI